MIEGIFFDAHGVLYEREESTTRFARKLLADHGYPAAVSGRDQEYLDGLRSQASVGLIGAKTYWDEFLLRHGVTAQEARTGLVTRIMEWPHQVYELPGAQSTLQTLKQRGFVLGVITDTMYPLEWKMAWLKKIGVGDLIDVIACSTALGARKPDPAIYRDALARSSLAPKQGAFVGHEAREIDGAHTVGMTTVAVNYAPGTQADYYVDSLPELLTLAIFQNH